MAFIPFQQFEEFTNLERAERARYLYKKDPSATNLAEMEEAIRLVPRLLDDEGDRNSFKKENAEVRGESYFFQDNYHIAVLRHPRYGIGRWHEHDFFELVYVYSGSCDHFIDDKILKMQEGDLCILPPKMAHYIYTNQDDSLIANVLIRKSTFDRVFFPLLTGYDMLSTFFLHTLYQKNNSAYLLFACGQDKFIQKMVHEMYDEYISRKEYSPFILLGQLTQFLGMLMRNHHSDVYQMIGNKEPSKVNMARILSYIQENLQSITLSSLSREFSYSESACSRLIKETMGRNFRDIVRTEKVNRAAYLLKESTLSLSEIMDQVGYSDTSQFYKSFQLHYQMTPVQYRKNINKC